MEEIKLEKIHEDERGRLFLLKRGEKEFLLMETKAGFSRGGDYHQSVQHDIVLVGEVKFMFEEKDKLGYGHHNKVLHSGDKIIFKSNQPHMMTSLTDSLVIEWLEGSFEKSYYDPFRKLIK